MPDPAAPNQLPPDPTMPTAGRHAADDLAITDDVRARVDQVMRQHPQVVTALLGDGQYAWSMEWLRTLMGVVDEVLKAEALPYHVRDRVLRAVVCGSSNPDEALQRMERRKKMVEQLMREPVRRFVVPSEE